MMMTTKTMMKMMMPMKKKTARLFWVAFVCFFGFHCFDYGSCEAKIPIISYKKGQVTGG